MKKVCSIFTVYVISIFNCYSQGWEVLNSNVSVNLYGVYFTDHNTGFVCGLSGTMIKTTDAGLNWFNAGSGLTSSLYDVEFYNNSTGYCSGSLGIFKTNNSGQNWYSVFSDFQINEIEIVNSELIYAGGQNGVYKSSNQGLNWVNVMSAYTGYISGLHFLNENTGYAMGSIAATRKTTNGGANWTGGLPWSPGDYSFKECYFFNSGSGFVLYSASIPVFPPPNTINSYGIYKAQTMNSFFLVWSDQNRYLGGLSFPVNDTAYAVGGRLNESLILRSVNGGNNWAVIPSSNINKALNDVFFIDSKYGFAVGSDGTIIKTITGGINGINLINDIIPTAFSLSQNYPNPFNPSTIIRFSISGTSSVAQTFLSVYDILGKEIAILVNQELLPGTYSVNWDASNHPSGLYFYTLRAGDFSETKKMILMK